MPARVWDIIRSTFSYIYYSSTYMHTLVIFAFSNIDDVTWGTKGLAGGSGEKPYFKEKMKFVGTWLFTNAVLAYIMIMLTNIWY